jgi:hypothetical protein
MRYTALEKLFLFFFALIIIACFIIYTALHIESIGFLYSYSRLRNPYDVLVWLLFIGFIGLLYFSIRGIYKGRKNKLKNKFLVYSIIINIIYLCLFNPISFNILSLKPFLLSLPFWITMHILGIIYALIFMIKMLAEYIPSDNPK